VDADSGQLLLVDTATFETRPLGKPLELKLVVGPAYDEANRRLLASDAASGSLYSIDPTTQQTEHIMSLPVRAAPFRNIEFDDPTTNWRFSRARCTRRIASRNTGFGIRS
jgi:hypothetical protein